MPYGKGTQASLLSVIHSPPALTAFMVIELGLLLYSTFPLVCVYELVVPVPGYPHGSPNK